MVSTVAAKDEIEIKMRKKEKIFFMTTVLISKIKIVVQEKLIAIVQTIIQNSKFQIRNSSTFVAWQLISFNLLIIT